MSAFKQLLASDIITSPFEVNKNFSFIVRNGNIIGYGSAVYGSNIYGRTPISESNLNIDRFIGVKGNFLNNRSTTGIANTEYQVLIYDSIKELYYTNYLGSSLGSTAATSSILPGSDPSGDTLIGKPQTTNYYNYLGTDLTIPRFIPTGSGDIIGVISIPSKLFGDQLTPGSIKITSGSFTLLDDGEGTIYVEHGGVGFNYGNVIYEHGIITLTNSGSYSNGDGSGPSTFEGYGFEVYGDVGGEYGGDGNIITVPEISTFIDSDIIVEFSSSYTILETQYKTTIRENEFNFSLNPSLMSGSEGNLYPYTSGSYFSPYVTTVGLYSDDQELLAIGKLSQPLPTSRTTDTNIFINIDR